MRNYKGRFKVPHSQTSQGPPHLECCGEDWYWFDYGIVRFISYPEPYSESTWSQWHHAVGKLMDQADADPQLTFIVTFGHEPPILQDIAAAILGCGASLPNSPAVTINLSLTSMAIAMTTSEAIR
jgi:hypothetical protein